MKLKKQTFDKFGKLWVNTLTKELIRAGKKASGKLINSLDYRIQDEANGIQLLLESEDYLQWVDKGRKRGSYPPIKAIASWVKVKGISDKAVFGIARNIYKFGIKPTNVLDKTEKIVLSKLTELENELVNNIEEIVYNDFKKIEE